LNVRILTPLHQVFSCFFGDEKRFVVKDACSVFCYSCEVSFFVNEKDGCELVFKLIGLDFFCSDFNDLTVYLIGFGFGSDARDDVHIGLEELLDKALVSGFCFRPSRPSVSFELFDGDAVVDVEATACARPLVGGGINDEAFKTCVFCGFNGLDISFRGIRWREVKMLELTEPSVE